MWNRPSKRSPGISGSLKKSEVIPPLCTGSRCFLAGTGAGLGTGFAGMSAAAVISPMLITFLDMEPYAAVGIALGRAGGARPQKTKTNNKNKKKRKMNISKTNQT